MIRNNISLVIVIGSPYHKSYHFKLYYAKYIGFREGGLSFRMLKNKIALIRLVQIYTILMPDLCKPRWMQL